MHRLSKLHRGLGQSVEDVANIIHQQGYVTLRQVLCNLFEDFQQTSSYDCVLDLILNSLALELLDGSELRLASMQGIALSNSSSDTLTRATTLQFAAATTPSVTVQDSTGRTSVLQPGDVIIWLPAVTSLTFGSQQEDCLSWGVTVELDEAMPVLLSYADIDQQIQDVEELATWLSATAMAEFL
eukprot:m.23240 g.23240  ORF g.23240 m.23240 type:complete len:184 (-) comp11354_c0_seq2:110-661(-)